MEDDCGVGEDTEDHEAKNLGVGRQRPSLKLIRKSVSLKKVYFITLSGVTNANQVISSITLKLTSGN
jgi:hypothetical protein